jgi:hypothetical protein
VSAQVQIGQSINGEAAEDRLGSRGLSTNYDGNIIALGARYNDGNGDRAGHVRIFEYLNDTWVQLGDAIDGEDIRDGFGFSISLNSTGDVVAIGELMFAGGEGPGGVSVYRNISGNWEIMGSKIYGEEEDDRFGYAVSINDSGTVLAIGAPSKDVNGNESGQARIYEFDGINWIQKGGDINGDEMDNTGFSLSISSDGTIVAIGSPKDFEYEAAGEVRVYQFDSNDWVQLGSVMGGYEVFDDFGREVSINGNGTRIAISAPFSGSTSPNGIVRMFEYSSNEWVQLGEPIYGGFTHHLGFALSLNDEGNLVGIGGIPNNSRTYGILYEYNNGNWIQFGDKILADNLSDNLGETLALSGSGEVALLASPGSDYNGPFSGQARAYSLPLILNNETFNPALASIYLSPNPASITITIHNPKGIKLDIISIYDSKGQLLKTIEISNNNVKTVLDISYLPTASYFLVLESEKGKLIKSILKR